MLGTREITPTDLSGVSRLRAADDLCGERYRECLLDTRLGEVWCCLILGNADNAGVLEGSYSKMNTSLNDTYVY